MRIITTVLFSILFTIGLHAKKIEWNHVTRVSGEITKFTGNIEDFRDDKGNIVIEIPEFMNNAPGVGGAGRISHIGEGAFANLGIDKVIFKGYVREIKKNAFANNDIKELIFETMEGGRGNQFQIRERAFANNQLSVLALPKDLYSIDEYAFTDNEITSVTCKSSTFNRIKEGVFKNNQLTQLPFANQLIYIGKEAFANNKLKSIDWDNTNNFPTDRYGDAAKIYINANAFKDNPGELFPLALRKGSTKQGSEICWVSSKFKSGTMEDRFETNDLKTALTLEDSNTEDVYCSYELRTVNITFNALQPVTYATEEIKLKAGTNIHGLSVSYSSSNNEIAKCVTYSESGKLIINKPGKVTITAKNYGYPKNNSTKPYAVTQELIISKAPLQVSVANATRKVGEENPEFVINYSGFVRGENKSALSKQATASTKATTTSAEGKYPIVLTSPVSENYDFTLNNGVLTVENPSHSISYVLNGGTVSGTNPSSYKESTGVSSFKPAAKAHYAFDGWYSDAAFKNKVTSIAAGSTSNYTLYAKFVAKSHTISYVLNGGTVSGANPSSYKEHEGVASFKSATKAHYAFDGWYSDAAFKNKVNRIAVGSTSNYNLYAKFTPKSHTISYVLNGGTVSGTNPSSYKEHEGVSSFKSAAKKYFTFDGWYSDAAFKNKVSRIAVGSTTNYTLYAKFAPKSHTISYVLNGGAVSGTNPTSYKESVGVSSFKPATKAHYTFEGWFIDAAFKNKVSRIAVGSSNNYTLYAKFEAITHTIQYVLDGGSNASGNPTSYEESVGVASFAPATKAGFTFEGWYSDATFNNKVESVASGTENDVTLYAKWGKATAYNLY
jgi:uncharacterized repeat protein (TIGR02543 family)